MAKIVADQFKLDCTPQSLPRTRIHPIYKHTPKLREKRFYPLSETTYQRPMTGYVGCRYQQCRRLLSQLLSYLFAPISKLCKRYASIRHKGQAVSCFSVIDIATSQQPSNEVTFDIDCGVKLEAKEPSFAALSKIGSFFSQQSHTPVSYAL